MLTLLLLMVGFLLAAVALAALTLAVNDYERKVSEFCDTARKRYEPGFYDALESRAARTVDALAKTRGR